jgi:hypothetical protein
MDNAQWQAFIGDKPAREAAEAKWLQQEAKLKEAERLLFDEKWAAYDDWPGVICRGPTGEGLELVDIETWAYMRALVRGMGEVLLRQDRERKERP